METTAQPATVYSTSTTTASLTDSSPEDIKGLQLNRIASRPSREQSALAPRDAEKLAADSHGEDGSSTEQAHKGRQVKGYRWFLVCASLYLGVFLYGLDTTIAADVS
jgi:hypothetical protein